MPVEDEPAPWPCACNRRHQIDDTRRGFVTRDANPIDRLQKVRGDFGTFRHITGRIRRRDGNELPRGLDQEGALRVDLSYETCAKG
jgi:hypothetical protein